MRSATLLLAALLACPGYGAEAPTGTEGVSATTVADPYAGLTPAQQTAADDTIQKIKDEHGVIFPDGNPNSDLYKQVMADMAKDRITFFDRLNEWNGGDEAGVVAGSPIDGGFLLKSQYQRNVRNFNDTRYLGSAGSFELMDSNQNILEDENRRLNKIANKISRSKFACGQFDWVVQLRGKFNKAALTKYVDKLAESALAAAPMALLANLSPTLYEIVKWLRMTASMELDADKITCQQMEQSFTDIGRRTMRGDGYADCIKANQNLGVSEAHRICNQDQSPFDGVENASGKIVGFQGNTDNMNLTQFIGDRISTGQPTPVTASLQDRNAANSNLAAAQSALAAAPDPGDADPSWADGSTEKTAWQEAKNKHESAQINYDRAVKGVQGTYASDNDTGVWSRLRNSLADNLGGIIGNIDLGLKANIQLGNQDQYKLILAYKHQAFLLAQSLADQLVQHFDIINANSRDPDTIKQSYYHCMAYMFATSQAPWQKEKAFQVHDHLNTDVYFSYSTIDKMAVLWAMNRRGEPDSLARTTWAVKYQVVECINQVTLYEVYNYLYEHCQRDKSKVISEAQNMLKQDGSDKIVAAIRESLDTYENLLKTKRDECIAPLAVQIDLINSFDIRRAPSPFEPTGRTNPIVPADLQNIGR